MFDIISKRFSDAFSKIVGKRSLTEKNVHQALIKIRESLLEADVPFGVVEKFVEELKSDVVGKKVVHSVKPSEMLIKIVYEKLTEFLGGKRIQNPIKPKSTVMVMGLQGSGKTTTIGKLAHLLKTEACDSDRSIRILTGSIDYYRPAAIEQLEIIAQKAGIHFFRSSSNSPKIAAKDIYEEFQKGAYDILLLDTAGRMHIDASMLEEIKDIQATLDFQYKILILDSMTGQESLRVAQEFNNHIGFDSAILTKSDSDARGGAAFAFSYVLSKPIMYLGTGERIEDLEAFRPERMASRILGMGDIETLSERIDKELKENEKQSAQEKFVEGNFSLDDFAQQIEMVGRLGSLSSIMKFIPGAASFDLNRGVIEQKEREMKLFRAIISSMTMKERLQPKILNKSRKKRISKGAGVVIADIDKLLILFEQSRQYAKLFKKGGFNTIFK